MLFLIIVDIFDFIKIQHFTIFRMQLRLRHLIIINIPGHLL